VHVSSPGQCLLNSLLYLLFVVMSDYLTKRAEGVLELRILKFFYGFVDLGWLVWICQSQLLQRVDPSGKVDRSN